MIVSVCLVSLCISASAAQALSVSPSIIEEQINPGETRTLSISVLNDEAEPVQLFASIQKFLPLGANGQQRFLPPEDTRGLPSWTFLSLQDVPLKPGEKRMVPVQFRVPLDAEQGGAYEAIFLSTQPPAAQGKSIGVRSRVGVLVLLNVGDVGRTDLEVTDWRLREEGARHARQGVVQVSLQNLGRTHVHPKGEVVVRNMFGRVVERASLNRDGGRVLPASARSFEIVFGGGTQHTSWMGRLLDEVTSFGMGTYTVSLEGVDGLRTNPNALRFSVWPWRVAVVLFSTVVLLGFLFRWYRARLVRAWQSSRS